MALRDSIVISASPETVWMFIAEPERMADWNPKIISIDRSRSGVVMLAEQFTTLYRMSGKETKCRTEVVSLVPYDHVAYAHQMDPAKAESIVQERYEMRESGTNVRVTQVIDLSRSGISWYFRLLIGFIHRFGRPVEEPILKQMKRLAEQAAKDAGYSSTD